MRAGTEQTIREAWTRLLDVEALGSPERILRVDDTADTITFVRILGQGVLKGPRWALDRAGNLRDEELARLSLLMRLGSDHGARPLGVAELSYAESRVEHAELVSTQDEASVSALEAACTPEDVDEVGLGQMPHRWVVLAPAGSNDGSLGSAGHDHDDSAEGVPLAGSGYVVWEGLLAHMGVLASPHARGRGYGVLAGAVGTNAALEAGLIPQWRSRIGNEASKRVAQVLGYEPVGTQTTVFVDRPVEDDG